MNRITMNRKNRISTWKLVEMGWKPMMMGLVALCFAGATARGATINVENIVGGADYHNPDHWVGDVIPTSTDTAHVNNDRTLTHSTGTHAITALRLLSWASRPDTENAYFNMTGGDLSVTFDVSMGYLSGGTKIATLSGGTLSAGSVQIGHNHADVAGEMTISGGTLNWGIFRVGTLASGKLTVDGTGATISGASILLNEYSTLQFNLGADSVSALNGTGNLTIDSAAALVIDGSNFTGGLGDSIDLITFGGNVAGSYDTNNITFQNFSSGLTGEIGYDADSMYLTVIPEPSSMALVMAASVGVTVLLRRRQR